MTTEQVSGPRSWRMQDLPGGWRCLLAVLVVALGLGYLAAVGCTYGQTEMVDGQPGMSARDLVLKFHGGFEPVAADGASHSRMLEMSNSDMRDEFSSDDNFEVLTKWLAAGAVEEQFALGAPVTPKAVLEADCTHCHSADSPLDIARTSPFGPDAKHASYAMVAKFTAPLETQAAVTWHSPANWRRLAVTTHVHLFAVPILTVIMGALFLWAGWPKGETQGMRRLRTAIAVAPMVFFLGDVSCWWLARIPSVGTAFALAIGGFGALFGITYVTQWSVIMIGLVQPARLLRQWPLFAGDPIGDGVRALGPRPRPARQSAVATPRPRPVGANASVALQSAEREIGDIAVMLRNSAYTPARSHSVRPSRVEAFDVGEALQEIADRLRAERTGLEVDVRVEPSWRELYVEGRRNRFLRVMTAVIGRMSRPSGDGALVLSAHEVDDHLFGGAVRLVAHRAGAHEDAATLQGASPRDQATMRALGGRLESLRGSGASSALIAVFRLAHTRGLAPACTARGTWAGGSSGRGFLPRATPWSSERSV